MYLIVAIAFFLVSTVTCHWRTVNGNLAPSYSFPYVVSIQYRPSNTSLCIPSPCTGSKCTGSIIDKYWILTAAQCVEAGSSQGYQIQAGTTIIGPNQGIIHEVSGISVHPNFDLTLNFISNDVALLKLVDPLDFNENVSSIGLGTLQSKDVLAVGWDGTILNQIDHNDTNLNFVLLEVMEIEKCTQIFQLMSVYNEVDSRTHICAYDSRIERSVCYGDLGGPLVDVTTSRLVGVLSNLEICSGMYPARYMKISEFIDWINSVTGLNFSLD